MIAEVADKIKAPFPYAGGKSRVAAEVWSRLGNAGNYVEPFFGSGAVLFARPAAHEWWNETETVNDADGLLANFWRATQAEPEVVARWADWPVNENDLHARHSWLVGQKDNLKARLEGDADFYDAKAAGWWVWGICLWIGGGWCNTNGPWIQVDGELVNRNACGQHAEGVRRQIPHLSDAGMGINRQIPHLGDAGRGHCEAWGDHLAATMQALGDRLRRVRVCCGDWSRVCGPSPTVRQGLTALFFDPPYSHAERAANLYTTETDCAGEVLEWCKSRGDDPRLRIALCGYDGEHNALEEAGWDVFAWKASGGYSHTAIGDSRGKANAHRERIWFSPHCLRPNAGTEEGLTLI